MTTWFRRGLARPETLGRLHVLDHLEAPPYASTHDIWVAACGTRVPRWHVNGEWELDEIPSDACRRCVPGERT